MLIPRFRSFKEFAKRKFMSLEELNFTSILLLAPSFRISEMLGVVPPRLEILLNWSLASCRPLAFIPLKMRWWAFRWLYRSSTIFSRESILASWCWIILVWAATWLTFCWSWDLRSEICLSHFCVRAFTSATSVFIFLMSLERARRRSLLRVLRYRRRRNHPFDVLCLALLELRNGGTSHEQV